MYYPKVLLLICYLTCNTLASTGDQAPMFQRCLKTCKDLNCEEEGIEFKENRQIVQDFMCMTLQWSCTDECKYKCMWPTLSEFNQRGYKMPKFYGKWAFPRVLGLQEPASVFASLLNLVVHLRMHSIIRKKFPVSEMPIVAFWHLFTFVCVHAWAWSAVFHARDTPFTEFMDYAGALSMVIALFLAAVYRVYHKRPLLGAGVAASTVLAFAQHVRYLYTGRVDYDYNMLVNVVVGAVGSFTWLRWAVARYVAGRRYTWRVVLFVALTAAAAALELADFPPAAGAWDAHALWHLSTAPLPYFFYRFVIDDLEYLKDLQYCKRKDQKLV